jgi:rubrerythrin
MNEEPHNADVHAGEGDQRGQALLASKKTLKEILEVATSFEQTAHDFYTALIPRVSKRIRYLVEELAAEELEHLRLFTELAARPDIAGEINREIVTPVDDHVFSNYVHLPRLDDAPDDQSILQYALFREHAAMEQYRELALNTEPGPVHDLFEFLANEETKHKRELEKTYYQIVHSGGV